DTATGFQRWLMIGHTNIVTSVAFNPQVTALVSASTDGTARVWDIGGRPTSILTGHDATVFGAKFSPDGDLVVTAGADRTARLWNPGSQPELRAVSTQRVVDLAIDGNGTRFVTAGDGVVLWNASPLHVIRRLSDAVATRAAISPDGTRVVAALARGRLVTVIDAHSGKVLRRLRA